MFGLGGQEIIVILLLATLIFGAKKLPDLARSIGSAVKEFKKEINSDKSEHEITGQAGNNEKRNNETEREIAGQTNNGS